MDSFALNKVLGAMEAKGGKSTSEKFDKFLTHPQSYIPGTPNDIPARNVRIGHLISPRRTRLSPLQ